MLSLRLDRYSVQQILLLAFSSFLLTVFLNPGFMAMDEFAHGIVRYIPAQDSFFENIVRQSGVRSPLQLIPHLAIAKAALFLGVENPFWQYRLVVIVLGLLNFAIMAWALNIIFKENDRLVKIAFLILGFHYLSPFVLTRPMFEVPAAPWLLLCVAFLMDYLRKPSWSLLVYAAFAVSLGFVLRPHVGFPGIVIPLVPLVVKRLSLSVRFRDAAIGAIAGAFFFVLAGLPDYFMRGSLHASLKEMFFYNAEFGGTYNTKPFYFYFPVIAAFLLLPFWLAHYPKGFWRDFWKKYWVVILSSSLFVALHFLFDNKYERYMISILPLLFVLIVPVLNYFLEDVRRHRARLGCMLVLNFIVFIPASFITVQKNIFSLVDYVHENSWIERLYVVDESTSPIPDVFFPYKKTQTIQYNSVSDKEKLLAAAKDCSGIVVFRQDQLEAAQDMTKHFEFKTELTAGLVERLSIALNPKHNKRRGSLFVFSCAKS